MHSQQVSSVPLTKMIDGMPVAALGQVRAVFCTDRHRYVPDAGAVLPHGVHVGLVL